MPKTYEVRLRTGAALTQITAARRQVLDQLAEVAAGNGRRRVKVRSGHLQSTIAAIPTGADLGDEISGVYAGADYALTQERREAFLEPGAFEAAASLGAIVAAVGF